MGSRLTADPTRPTYRPPQPINHPQQHQIFQYGSESKPRYPGEHPILAFKIDYFWRVIIPKKVPSRFWPMAILSLCLEMSDEGPESDEVHPIGVLAAIGADGSELTPVFFFFFFFRPISKQQSKSHRKWKDNKQTRDEKKKLFFMPHSENLPLLSGQRLLFRRMVARSTWSPDTWKGSALYGKTKRAIFITSRKCFR